MRAFSALCIALILICSSCTTLRIDKRHYRSGFYVNRSHAGQVESERSEITETTRESRQTFTTSEAELCEVAPVDTPAVIPVATSPALVQQKVFVPEDTVPPSAKKTEPDPVDRQIKKAKVLGVLALICTIPGLFLLEFSVFGFILVLIGLGFAIMGLKFGKLALANTRYKRRDANGKEVPDEKRKKAKQAYWLSLIALLAIIGYVIIRFGIAVGTGTIAIAFILLGIALALFVLFKMGVFSDLKN